VVRYGSAAEEQQRGGHREVVEDAVPGANRGRGMVGAARQIAGHPVLYKTKRKRDREGEREITKLVYPNLVSDSSSAVSKGRGHCFNG
jgi:hypothetical protein